MLWLNPSDTRAATTVAEIDRAREQGKIALFYLFQNSTQFGRNLDNVDLFYWLEVRSSQITYNWQNWAGAGCYEAPASVHSECRIARESVPRTAAITSKVIDSAGGFGQTRAHD